MDGIKPAAGNDTAPIAVDSDWGSPNHVHVLMLIGLTVVGIYVCYLLAIPFLSALAMAMALAVLFLPLQKFLESGLRPNFAALLAVALIVAIVVAPAVFIGQRVIAEAVKGADLIRTNVESGEWRHIIESNPRLTPVVEWVDRQFDLKTVVNTASGWITATAGKFVAGSLVQLTGIVLTFYFLFYFLRDRVVALEAIRDLSPMSRMQMNRLFVRVADTIHATIYGTLVVAFVQGLLGGLMFWWLGLPAPLLWGIVMGLLAIVPVLGAFVIWIPASVFLLLDGSPVKALVLALWGAIVVGGIDNVLHPILVGNRLRMHSVVTFIAIVGGLIVFGATGLILGPVAFTATQWLLEVWRRRIATAEAEAEAGATPTTAVPPSHDVPVAATFVRENQ